MKLRPLVVVTLLVVPACTGDDDALREPTTSSTPAVTRASTTTTPTTTTTTSVSSTGSGASAVTDPVATPPSVPVATAAGDPAELPEVGVPGLDSDDAFCAAWSRWAGTYQVVLVSNAFGSGGPEALASLEVVAAPVLVEAAATMATAWPSEIASERDVAVDGLLGPITRRLGVARDALVAAGADEAMIAAISAAWLDGLAVRDPSTPDFAIDLPDEIWAVVDRAAADVASQLVAFADDPSLVTIVDTPRTEEYIAVTCPDQGTLSGLEVDP